MDKWYIPGRHTLEFRVGRGSSNDRIIVRPSQQLDIFMHDHEFFELAYVTGGTALHNLNGEIGTVSKGDFFIIDYGTLHAYQDCKDFTLINCLFLPELVDETLADCRVFGELLKVWLIRYYKQYYGQTPSNRIFHDEDGTILSLILGMQEEYMKKDTGFTEIMRGKLLEILILTMRKVAAEQGNALEQAAESTVVTEAVQYIKSHYRDRAVIAQFCEKHHYSIQYFSRKFRRETGLTAMEYLQKIRIEKCCELLAGSDLTIQEIACQVGYEDIKFFYMIFRRMLHMAPGEYRKMTGACR